jgi:hypothetical protein
MRTAFIGVRDRLDAASTRDQRWRRAAWGERAVDSMGAAAFTLEVEDSTEVGFTADDVTFGGGSTI